MRGSAVEDYVKAIYKLQDQEKTVSTTALAAKMGTTPAAATKMLKQLAQQNLISYTPYYGGRLTSSGEKIALEVIRHHRLIERYLAQAMGYPWDQVDAEAEQLEHVISEEFEARIDALLGYPTICPHGDPIPGLDGTLVETKLGTLAECLPGDIVTIARVKDTDAAVLRTLAERGMILQTTLVVIAREAIDGLLRIRVGNKEEIVGPALAGSIFVMPTDTKRAA